MKEKLIALEKLETKVNSLTGLPDSLMALQKKICAVGIQKITIPKGGDTKEYTIETDRPFSNAYEVLIFPEATKDIHIHVRIARCRLNKTCIYLTAKRRSKKQDNNSITIETKWIIGTR